VLANFVTTYIAMLPKKHINGVFDLPHPQRILISNKTMFHE